MGENRKGISVAYCTDSRPVDRITKFVEGVQLFICEGMYGEEEKKQKARENKHMLFPRRHAWQKMQTWNGCG